MSFAYRLFSSSSAAPTPTLPPQGTTLYQYKDVQGQVFQAVWSPDGKYIACGTSTHEAHVWDAETGNTITVYRGHYSPIWSLAWSPDSKYVVCSCFPYTDLSSVDPSVQVFEALTGTKVLTYNGFTSNNAGLSVSWSPDGKYIASAGDNVQIWDAHAGSTISIYQQKTAKTVSWSPDGKMLAANTGGEVQVFNAPEVSGDLIDYNANNPNVTIYAFVWSPDGKYIATSEGDSSGNYVVKVWDATSGNVTLTYHPGSDAAPTTLSWSADGKYIASGSALTQGVQIWEPATGNLLYAYRKDFGSVQSVNWAPDSRRVVSVGGLQYPAIWVAV